MKVLVIILTAIFTGLKLAGAIGWSWWWVVSPILIYVGGCVVLVVIALLMWLLHQCHEFYSGFIEGLEQSTHKRKDKNNED